MTQFDKTLFKRHNIGELVGVYEEAKEIIEHSYQELEKADELLQAAGIEYATSLPNQHRRYKKGEDTTSGRVMGEINEKVWRHVVALMEIKKFLSIKKAKELDEQLDKGEFPPISYDNIFNTFLAMMAQAEDFAADQIKEVYDWLRPRSEDRREYKTNSVWELGKKVIKYGIEQPWSVDGNWHLSHWYEQHFIALDKSFHTLDGAPVNNLKGSYYMPLVSAIREATGVQPEGETDYFKFKLFKNGNIHVTFKRPDLVKEFNRVAGGGMLSPKNSQPQEQDPATVDQYSLELA